MTQRDPVLRAVRAALQRHVQAGQRVAAAVSGGADSLALALAIRELAPALGLSLAVVSVDHGLRPGSAAEIDRVEAWTRSLGVPFGRERVAVEKAGGLEAAARKARYLALERLADALEASWIATGHTASDQAETVLLRLGRGAGTRGARGILERRGRILRPLLGVTRGELERFLAEREVAPLVDDPSNVDLSRARNRIRHRVLPELRLALGPGADRALARFAQLARADDEALSGWAERLDPDRAALEAVPDAVLARWLRARCEALDYLPNAAELARAIEAVRRPGTREWELGRAIRIRVDRQRVQIERATARPSRSLDALSLMPGKEVSAIWAGLSFSLEPMGLVPATAPLELALPARVALPLVIRPRRDGDRFQSMASGTTSLKRLLMDAGIPRAERDALAMVTDARGTLLWIVGVRVAEPLRTGLEGPRDGHLLRARRL